LATLRGSVSNLRQEEKARKANLLKLAHDEKRVVDLVERLEGHIISLKNNLQHLLSLLDQAHQNVDCINTSLVEQKGTLADTRHSISDMATSAEILLNKQSMDGLLSHIDAKFPPALVDPKVMPDVSRGSEDMQKIFHKLQEFQEVLEGLYDENHDLSADVVVSLEEYFQGQLPRPPNTPHLSREAIVNLLTPLTKSPRTIKRRRVSPVASDDDTGMIEIIQEAGVEEEEGLDMPGSPTETHSTQDEAETAEGEAGPAGTRIVNLVLMENSSSKRRTSRAVSVYLNPTPFPTNRRPLVEEDMGKNAEIMIRAAAEANTKALDVGPGLETYIPPHLRLISACLVCARARKGKNMCIFGGVGKCLRSLWAGRYAGTWGRWGTGGFGIDEVEDCWRG
jgi:hypothetical protein